MNKKYVFLLTHIYDYGVEDEHEETKILGVYTTREKAEKALERYFKLEGFNNYPKECFFVGECLIDEDLGWKEGFFKWDDPAESS
ncbi:hypothetical protein ACFWM3_14350 [Gottfriedia sp. NPDC058432]|uniref:DUF7336 domain-containing protein n=1 Tax=Gottfriedia sp. NPDC058432 TaxID=3346497 RepID=UPI0036602906